MKAYYMLNQLCLFTTMFVNLRQSRNDLVDKHISVSCSVVRLINTVVKYLEYEFKLATKQGKHYIILESVALRAKFRPNKI